MEFLFAAAEPTPGEMLLQHLLIGLTNGSLFALIAIGYTMVYGIIGLINFAHGDLFMLGSFLSLSLISTLTGYGLQSPIESTAVLVIVVAALLIYSSLFCAGLNMAVDYVVYKPLRNAPKLAPLVSAIGVSFVFMNIGLFWKGAADVDFPQLISNENILGSEAAIRFTWNDLMVISVTVPIMIALTLFVKFTRLGTAMRATEQNPTAAALMGINVDRVIALTFAIGGALGGAASVVYGLYINTVSFQMGFQNGLYAFTAAVLGGIGSIPGAVLGGLLIGLVRSLGSAYVGEKWTSVLVFGILILILVFRPSGLLGSHAKEKV
ncbi:MAG TPA: branched-chain amino acid ABC transporter permease [Pirellulaceae bacterium]|nr:branched-chain amino acid ABC transporter permease [Pirellulaceae bacterium]